MRIDALGPAAAIVRGAPIIPSSSPSLNLLSTFLALLHGPADFPLAHADGLAVIPMPKCQLHANSPSHRA
jgi:hypothetical protein